MTLLLTWSTHGLPFNQVHQLRNTGLRFQRLLSDNCLNQLVIELTEEL